MANPLIELKSDRLHFKGVALDNPHHITIPEGLTVVGGPNGAGKTTLAYIIASGWNFRTNVITSPRIKPTIKLLQFSDIHSLAGASTGYYQQRFESSMNDDVPTVAQVMGRAIETEAWQRLTTRLKLIDIENKRINYLSSGELRKLLIINALTQSPDLLILDNPYIGLDEASRSTLNEALNDLIAQGINIILLLCNPDDIPDATDTLITVDRLSIGSPMANNGDIAPLRHRLAALMDFAVNTEALPPAPPVADTPAKVVLKLDGCEVKYGKRMILKDINWEIKQGERWALAGPNGSGKSTLLSLVHADNPQGYSNAITLFDRQRGTGETIWDIKRRIGYISPEMHLYFNGGGNVETIIAQGFNDTVGLYVKTTPWQLATARQWIELFHLEEFAERRFNTLSSGEQRMVLIARTLIKQPELLILDEPLHGLDSARKRAVRAVINHIASRPDRAMSLIYVTHYRPEVPECVTHTKTLSRL